MSVNKEHLLKIRQHILEEPLRLNMSDFIKYLEPGTYNEDLYVDILFKQPTPECCTVCCIAGWSMVLRGLERYNKLAELYFLGLPSDSLFFIEDWPTDLKIRYRKSTTVQEKAQVAIEAIDRIIAGDGFFIYKDEDETDNTE